MKRANAYFDFAGVRGGWNYIVPMGIVPVAL